MIPQGQTNHPQPIEDLIVKFWQMHDYIGLSHYIGKPNIEVATPKPFQIGPDKNEDMLVHASDVILFSLMSGFMGRNLIYKGNYGLGKTTTAKAVSSLIHCMPMEIIDAAMLQGHNNLTEEKITGRLDFHKLQTEGEKVIFSLYSQLPAPKLLDELNRIPRGTQNILLRQTDEKRFQYLNEFIISSDLPFLATVNFEDGGNTPLTPAILDRFDGSVEVNFPLFHLDMVTGYANEKNMPPEAAKAVQESRNRYQQAIVSALTAENPDDVIKTARHQHLVELGHITQAEHSEVLKGKLSNQPIAESMQTILMNPKLPYEQKLEHIATLSHKFGLGLNGLGTTHAERKVLTAYARSMEIHPDANLLINAFFDSVNAIVRTPDSKASNHAQKYAAGKIDTNLSVRARTRSVPDYACMLALLKGEDYVSTETVLQVMPYVLDHRVNPKINAAGDEYSQKSEGFRRTQAFVDEFFETEFSPNKDLFDEAYLEIVCGEPNTFIAENDSADQPFFKAMKELYGTDNDAATPAAA